MPVTLKDVAKKAGVSIKTVSRVVNEQGEISDSTRRHVMEIIQELGYRPNRLARGLLTGRTQTVGIIIPDIKDPFFPELILGAEQVARARQFNVFLCNANRDPDLETHYVDVLRDRQVDGLMLAGSRLQQNSLQQITADQAVVILSPFATPNATVFTMNDYDASYKAGVYLSDLGHRRIAYLDGGWVGSSRRRREGFIRALQDRGVEPLAVPEAPAFPTAIDAGYEVGVRLLTAHPALSAIACYSDMLAIGVLNAAHDLGRPVPGSLSVVGYNNVPEAARCRPPLTTIHFDRAELGAEMMNRLLDMVEGTRPHHERIHIEGELLIRATCAPA